MLFVVIILLQIYKRRGFWANFMDEQEVRLRELIRKRQEVIAVAEKMLQRKKMRGAIEGLMGDIDADSVYRRVGIAHTFYRGEESVCRGKMLCRPYEVTERDRCVLQHYEDLVWVTLEVLGLMKRREMKGEDYASLLNCSDSEFVSHIIQISNRIRRK